MADKSLKDLLDTYEKGLVGSSFSVVKNGGILFSFSFQLSDFIHLTGIQHVVFGAPGAQMLRGINGIAAIAGGTMTRERLESINGAEYVQYKARIDAMDFLCNSFFSDPGLRLFEFNPALSLRATKLPRGYVFISSDGKNAFFLQVKKGKHDYIPTSFFPCKLSIVENQRELFEFSILRTHL